MRVIFALLILCSCGIKYAPPPPKVPKNWCHPVCETTDLRCFNWWQELQDPIICTLLQSAEKHSLDLRLAKLTALEKNTCQSCVDYKEALNNLRVEVVDTYIKLRGFQESLTLLKNGLKIQNQSLKLTEELLGKEDVTSFDIQIIEGQIALLNAQIPSIQMGIDKSIHHLSVLLGELPCSLRTLLCKPLALPHLPQRCPIGTPCEFIARREDVKRAICDYIEASQLGICSIQEQEALASYQKTVLAALEEGENALVTFEMGKIKVSQLQKAYELALQANKTAHDLFDRGLKSSRELIATDQSLLKSETELLEGRLEVLHAYIDLYKTMNICL